MGPSRGGDRQDDALKAFVPRAVETLMTSVLGDLEQRLGLSLDVTFEPNPIIPKRVAAGEAFDLALTNPWYVPDLVDAGLVAADLHRPFGRTRLAIAGRDAVAGAPTTAPEAIVGLLRRAGSIAYTADGTSGRRFLEAPERLGIGDEIGPRLVPMRKGQSPVRAAAAGDVALAIAPRTTAVSAPRVGVLATFPAALGTDIDMSVFAGAYRRDDARTLRALDHLTDPVLDPVLAEHGLVRFAFPD